MAGYIPYVQGVTNGTNTVYTAPRLQKAQTAPWTRSSLKHCMLRYRYGVSDVCHVVLPANYACQLEKHVGNVIICAQSNAFSPILHPPHPYCPVM